MKKIAMAKTDLSRKAVSAEYFEEMMEGILNWILDCQLENAALREALEINQCVTYKQVRKKRKELERVPHVVEMRRFFSESEGEERLSALKNFEGSTIH